MDMQGQARQIYRITGADREGFLQGLVSNDVRLLNQGQPVYAALLTPQGKYLADFLLIPAEDAVLLDVAADLGPGLVKRLMMYRLRADVQIAPSDLVLRRGLGPCPAGGFADPRHPALGWRAYIAPADLAAFDAQHSQAPAPDWLAIRLRHGIPESGIELTPETYILEAGFERLHGVDFRKGCYVGQEVTARMKHKTTLRKGLVSVTIEGPAPPPGTPILTAEGREAGILYSAAGGLGLAHLRFDRAEGVLQADGAVIGLAPAAKAADPATNPEAAPLSGPA